MRLTRFVVPFAVVAALAVAIPATASAEVRPAVSLPAVTDGSYAILNDGSDVGQSFVAGATGGLDRIVVPVWRSPSALGDLQVTVSTVGDDGLPATSLASTTVANAAVPTQAGVPLVVDFSSSSVLEQGRKYAVIFSAPGTTRHDYPHYVVPFAAAPYADGDRLRRDFGAPAWGLDSGDLALVVDVDGAVVAPPVGSSPGTVDPSATGGDDGTPPATGGEDRPSAPTPPVTGEDEQAPPTSGGSDQTPPSTGGQTQTPSEPQPQPKPKPQPSPRCLVISLPLKGAVLKITLCSRSIAATVVKR